jgi:prepilin-type N-terminal cleavage/methylation domain-containing protein
LGFTLIELLVVIAIIAILAAILFPVVRTRTRERTPFKLSKPTLLKHNRPYHLCQYGAGL